MSSKLAKRDEGLFAEGRPDFCRQRTQAMEVMCLGLSRTGTTTMLEALSILGYGNAYNSRDMMRRQQQLLYVRGLRAKYEGIGRPFSLEQFESLWGEYRVISGEPAFCFAAECIELYPDANVILTVRDNEEQWLASLSNTMWYRHQLWLTKFIDFVDPVHSNIKKLTDPFWKYMFWDDVPNHGIRVYREHNAMVERLAAGRVLVYNTKEGWEPLCRFFGKDVPPVDFPHVNKTNEHRNMFAVGRRQALARLARRLLVKGALPSLVVALMWWKRARLGAVLDKVRR